jgi:hypothetical protein
MPTVKTVTIVDTTAHDWIKGAALLADMDPGFRANLGPSDEVNAVFECYLVKPLLREDGTGRRVDLCQFLPGYRDVTACFHDSAEEGFVMAGDLQLAWEGDFNAGDYFWRPPGWVHGAVGTEGGATALICFEGDRPSDGSGPNSRDIRPYDTAGSNGLFAETDEGAIGPRGRIPHRSSRWLPWQSGSVWPGLSDESRAAWSADNLSVRTLSLNVANGASSSIWKLAPGFAQEDAILVRDTLMLFVLEGTVTVDGLERGPGTFVYVPAGAELRPMTSSGATLFVKSDSAISTG